MGTRRVRVWAPIVVVLVLLVVAIVLVPRVQWGEYNGVSGEAWLRFWSAVVPTLFASAASLIAWLTLQQNRMADDRRYEVDRRDEFWERLNKAIELGVSQDLVKAELGADLLAFIYEDVEDDPSTTNLERELLRSVIVSVLSAVNANRRDQQSRWKRVRRK